MADTKISELEEVVSPASTDVLPIVSDDETKKVTVANLTAAEATARAAADTTLQTNITAEATARAGADAALQPLDSDLTAIAGLTPSNDDVIQRKAGAWANRTPAQLKADLVLVKADVGLGNADNTSDVAKPVSTATQTALDAKADLVGGLVPSGQLPSFVDDVIEAANFAALPGTGATGKIYVTLDDNKTYRWSGSAYVEISASLALGETSATAYRGDRGKTAYDHSQTTGDAHGLLATSISDGDTAHAPDGNAVFDALAGKVGGTLGATDNAATRADGTGGATAQGSPLTIADTTGALQFAAKTRVDGGTSDGVISVTNNAGTGVTGVTLGPPTSSFTLLKYTTPFGPFVEIRTGNDGDYAGLGANGIRLYSGATRVFDINSHSGNFGMASDRVVRWDSTEAISGVYDTGLARSAAGVVEVNNGTQGTLGDLKVRNLFTSLPTSDPAVAGQLWNDSGVVKVSAG